MSGKTPFQRVVDDLTDGCGCACHTGTGYRSSCEHCWDPGRFAAYLRHASGGRLLSDDEDPIPGVRERKGAGGV